MSELHVKQEPSTELAACSPSPAKPTPASDILTTSMVPTMPSLSHALAPSSSSTNPFGPSSSSSYHTNSNGNSHDHIDDLSHHVHGNTNSNDTDDTLNTTTHGANNKSSTSITPIPSPFDTSPHRAHHAHHAHHGHSHSHSHPHSHLAHHAHHPHHAHAPPPGYPTAYPPPPAAGAYGGPFPPVPFPNDANRSHYPMANPMFYPVFGQHAAASSDAYNSTNSDSNHHAAASSASPPSSSSKHVHAPKTTSSKASSYAFAPAMHAGAYYLIPLNTPNGHSTSGKTPLSQSESQHHSNTAYMPLINASSSNKENSADEEQSEHEQHEKQTHSNSNSNNNNNNNSSADTTASSSDNDGTTQPECDEDEDEDEDHHHHHHHDNNGEHQHHHASHEANMHAPPLLPHPSFVHYPQHPGFLNVVSPINGSQQTQLPHLPFMRAGDSMHGQHHFPPPPIPLPYEISNTQFSLAPIIHSAHHQSMDHKHVPMEDKKNIIVHENKPDEESKNDEIPPLHPPVLQPSSFLMQHPPPPMHMNPNAPLSFPPLPTNHHMVQSRDVSRLNSKFAGSDGNESKLSISGMHHISAMSQIPPTMPPMLTPGGDSSDQDMDLAVNGANIPILGHIPPEHSHNNDDNDTTNNKHSETHNHNNTEHHTHLNSNSQLFMPPPMPLPPPSFNEHHHHHSHSIAEKVMKPKTKKPRETKIAKKSTKKQRKHSNNFKMKKKAKVSDATSSSTVTSTSSSSSSTSHDISMNVPALNKMNVSPKRLISKSKLTSTTRKIHRIPKRRPRPSRTSNTNTNTNINNSNNSNTNNTVQSMSNADKNQEEFDRINHDEKSELDGASSRPPPITNVEGVEGEMEVAYSQQYPQVGFPYIYNSAAPKGKKFTCKFMDASSSINGQPGFCNRQFGQKCHWMRHCLEKHVPTEMSQRYQCRYCDMKYAQNSSLKEHVSICHSNTPPSFKCPYCAGDISFTRWTSVLRHCRNQHPDQEEPKKQTRTRSRTRKSKKTDEKTTNSDSPPNKKRKVRAKKKQSATFTYTEEQQQQNENTNTNNDIDSNIDRRLFEERMLAEFEGIDTNDNDDVEQGEDNGMVLDVHAHDLMDIDDELPPNIMPSVNMSISMNQMLSNHAPDYVANVAILPPHVQQNEDHNRL